MRVITGTAGGVRLKAPAGMQTRPTADRVKEALFSVLQFELEGRYVLDLFAGSGQLGIEALSRGAAWADFVDASPAAVKVVQENLRLTKLAEKGKVYRADYENFLQNAAKTYDIIFLDPPYAENFQEIALKFISEIDILRDGGIIICEKAVDRELGDAYPGLIRQKEYRYGTVSLVLFRKGSSLQ